MNLKVASAVLAPQVQVNPHHLLKSLQAVAHLLSLLKNSHQKLF